MGLSAKAVSNFLDEFGELREDGCYNKKTGRKISACYANAYFWVSSSFR